MKKKVEIEKIYSLSPMQEGILFHSLKDQHSNAYFEQRVFFIKGRLNQSLLKESFNRVVQRYDVLRTVFRWEHVKKPLQIVFKKRNLKIHSEDISHLEDKEKEKYLEEFKRKNRDRGFDLSKDILTRVSLVKTAKDSYHLIWSFHHIQVDGWSLGIIFKTLINTYRSLKEGKSFKPELAVSYNTYIAWLKNQDKEKGLELWKGYLEGYNQSVSFQKKKKSNEDLYRLEVYRFSIDQLLTDKMKTAASENQVTLSTLFHTIWGILLQRYNNTDDVVFGTVVSGRPTGIEEVENLVGLFINTIPIRIRMEKGTTFSQIIKQVQKSTLRLKPYEYLPLSDIQSNSELKNRLIDIIIGFENYSIEKEMKELNDERIGFTIKIMEIYEQTNYDFNVIITPGQNLEINFNFNSSVYDRDLIRRLSLHLKEAVKQVVENPGINVNEIDILSTQEKHRLLVDFNATDAAFPEAGGIHLLFAEQVQKTPENTAVNFPLDLKEIYNELASETINPGLCKNLEICSFKRNPYVYEKDLVLPGSSTTLKMLKTHRHNSVLVNINVVKLINQLSGQQNIRAIFFALKDMNLKFAVCSLSVGDLLEITINANTYSWIFSNRYFSEFLKLIKCLYRLHLIELSGIVEESTVGIFLGEKGFKEDEALEERFIRGNWLNPSRNESLSTLSTADVLLLGDTPGMPTTGLLYLASFLKRNGVSACCQFYDPARDYNTMKENIETMLEKIQPKIAAVSMKWFLYTARVFDICKIIKEYAAKKSINIKVVLGGNTASYYWEEVIKNEYIDYLIRGDGEEPLLKICRSPEKPGDVPNISYKAPRQKGKIIENPITYVQDETHSPGIYLSHLEEILISPFDCLFGTFYIYTHKGCVMNCLYCGGCNKAQQQIFNRKRVFQRGVEEVRKDVLEALPYTSTFQFDFDVSNEKLVDYCLKIWEGIELTNHFCIYSNLTLPPAQLIDLVQETFKYVYCDIDITTLSERHRQQLESLGLVKPQPTDAEIVAFLDRCETYDNIEVRINLITGLPYFTGEDIIASEKLLSKIMNNYSCFNELHWARLHAQPGAPIVENAHQHHMHSFATTYQDFLTYSQKNFNSETGHQRLENLNYPYIYFNDDELNSKVTRFYSENNLKIEHHKESRSHQLKVSETLSYHDLNEKTNQLAAFLKEKGVQPGSIVGLMLERSIDIITGILGILKTSSAYLPIDPENPPKRIQYMLTDSNSQYLLTQGAFTDQVEFAGETLNIRDLQVFKNNKNQIVDTSGTGHPAGIMYTIYTSGTTGQSKGVAVTHRNLTNYIYWFTQMIQLTDKDKSVITSSFAFDLGYTTLYPPLLRGGQCHILPRETYLSAEKLLNYIKKEGITYVKMTPSLFSVLVNHPGFSLRSCSSLRFAAVGGEAINPRDIEKAHQICSHLGIMNHYGPTEATIGCVAHLIDFDRFEEYKETPVIGKPIYNTRIYITDHHWDLLPIGVPGELCIAGESVARGYLNRPELTANKFCLRRPEGSFCKNRPLDRETSTKNFLLNGSQKNNMQSCNYASMHPCNHATMHLSPHHSPQYPIYLTGDRARWLSDGTIEFLGRIDHQVKIRGYRIELEEIENRILAHQKVKDAVVITRENKEKEKYICAYVVPIKEETRDQEITIRSILEPFKRVVQQHPDRIAIKTPREDFTYAGLDNYTNQVARSILENYDDRYMLSDKEKTRYNRQMLLAGWGMEAQEKLKSTTVFVAGAGGGASPTIIQLALAGIGTIKVCDFDEVELSNLNRQFLHDEERLEMNKAISAKMTISKTNPHVKVIPYTCKLTRENIDELLGDSAIIFDMFDDPADKFILSEYAAARQIPHLVISMTDINAYAAVFHVPHTPCYHCIFAKEKLETIVTGMKHYDKHYKKNPLAVAASSLFISTGVVVNEALKILLGFKEPAYNKFFYFNQRGAFENLVFTPGYKAMTHLFSDYFRQVCNEQGFDWEIGWRGNFLEELTIKPDPNCPVCGEKAKEKLQRFKKKDQNKSTAVFIESENHTVSKEPRAAVILDHDADMAAAILGALKAGKTYVPLMPYFSKTDLVNALEDSGARVIITKNRYSQLAEKIRNKVNKNISIININDMHYRVSGENLDIKMNGKQIAARVYPSESGELPPTFTDIYAPLLMGDTCYLTATETKKTPGPPLVSELRDFLFKELPQYMIPSHFEELEHIPLTPNGKVDRNALAKLETRKLEVENVSPENEIENKLAEISAHVLGTEKISVYENFFEKGLDSIKALQIYSRMSNVGMKLEIADIFKNPTIKQLAGRVKPTNNLVNQDIITGNVELTPIQKWFFENDFTSRHHFNLSVILYRKERFDEQAVSKVFLEILRHHDALRIVFHQDKNEIRQVNRSFKGENHQLFSLQKIDLRNKQDIEKEIKRESQRIQAEIDLKNGPLVKLGLFHTRDGDYLLIVIHHLLVDGISFRIILEDFFTGYKQVKEGKKIKYQNKTHSFKYWAQKLNEYANSEKALKEFAFWRAVESQTCQEFPKDFDFDNHYRIMKNNETLHLDFNESETELILKKVNQAYNTAINEILLAALGMALKKWGGIEKLAVNLEGHGREPIIHDVEISRTVGWFTTQFPVILDMSQANHLAQGIKIVKETLRNIPNKGIGYGILKYLTSREKVSRETFKLKPEISFNYLGEFGQATVKNDIFEVSDMNMGDTVSPYLEKIHAVDINGILMEGELRLSFTFNKYQYKRSRIKELVNDYQWSLRKMIRHCKEKEEKELTPADFTYSKISLEELDNLEDEISEID